MLDLWRDATSGEGIRRHRRSRLDWLATTALVAVALAPTTTLAGPDGCTTLGNTVTCLGDQSGGVLEGVDYQSPPAQIFIIEPSTAITPVAGNSGVDVSADDVGLYDLTVTVPNGIFVTGDIASGINAGLAAPVSQPNTVFNGDVIVNSTANISAIGNTVQGISGFVSGDGNVMITSVGDINVSSGNGIGEGINASVGQAGDVSVTSTGTIATMGVTGIRAAAGTGNATVNNTGDISTTGDSKPGILASTVDGAITIESLGAFSTSGAGASGILAIHNGDVSISSQGDITVTGTNAAGIGLIQGAEAATGAGVFISSFGDITAAGADSFGVIASLDTFMFASISTVGNITGGASAFSLEVDQGSAFLFLSDGTISGGSGSGIDFPNVVGADTSGAFVQLDSSATLTSASGTAITSALGSTTIENLGTIEGGIVLQPDGANSINNAEGSVLAPRGNLLVGDGNRVTSSGIFSPWNTGTLGTTTVTGDLVLTDTSTYQVDISDIGSDATSIVGATSMTGTLAINATTPESTFSAGDSFSILDATNGIFGGFHTVTDNLASLDAVPLIAVDRSQVAVVLTTDGIFTSGDCSSALGVITCSGDQSDGITNRGLMPDFATVTGTRLEVNNLTQPIGAPTNLPAVQVLVINPAGFTIDADLGQQGISTFNQRQTGISIENGDGDVTVRSAGDITVRGTGAGGIQALAFGSGNASVTSSSDIRTERNGNGILAQSDNGNVTVNNSGDITTVSDFSRGIQGLTLNGGSVDITNSGTIVTQDDGRVEPIRAQVLGGGDISITNTGNLTTGGNTTIFALVGDDDDDNGEPDGNITINTTGDLTTDFGAFDSNIDAFIEGEGDIDITATGTLTSVASFARGISAGVGGDVGNITIQSDTRIISENSGGISASFGGIRGEPNRIAITHSGDIDAQGSAISARGTDIDIQSEGNFRSTAAGFSAAIGVDLPNDGNVNVQHTGDIRVSLEGIANTVVGSGIRVVSSLFEGNRFSETVIDYNGSIDIVEGVGDNRNEVTLSAGITTTSRTDRNIAISAAGAITSAQESVHGIAAAFDPVIDDVQGNIDITSSSVISVTGDNANGIRTFGTTGNTVNVTLTGGSVTGGGGDNGSGVEFRGPMGTMGTLDVDAGSISALSGIAVRGLEGSETINNAGTITGSVLLGGGMNGFNNLMGGRFNSGPTVDLGGGALTNAGILAPGSSIGTTDLTGDLVLAPAGTLEIEIEGMSMADRINVSGTTVLDGALTVTGLGALNLFTANNTYTFIDSAGDVSGSFATVTDNIPDLDAQVGVVDGGDGGEEVRVTLVSGNTGGGGGGMPTPTTLSDKSIYPNTIQGSGHASRLFAETLQKRAMSGALPGQMNGALANGESLATSTHGVADPTYSAWLGVFGTRVDVDATARANGYDLDAGGFGIGAEGVFEIESGAIFRLGTAFGYLGGDVASGPSSADTESWNIGVYAGYERGPLIASGAISYAFTDADFTRVIPMAGGPAAVARGSSDGSAFGVSLAASYDIAPILGLDADVLRFAPIVRLDHVRADMDSFSETGAGMLNQTVAGAEWNRTWAGVGIQIATAFTTDDGITIRPELELRYDHAFGDANTAVFSNIAGMARANFTSLGARENDNAFVVGAGASIDFTESVSANFRYDGAFSGGTTTHRASGGLKVRF